MIEPQSGQGGASSSGWKANIERDGSEPAAPSDDGPEPGAERKPSRPETEPASPGAAASARGRA